MNSGTIVLGVLNGLIIGVLAVGFVLVYKANRFLNLAQAQLGVVSAILLAKVVNDWGWNWWLSFVVCIGIGIATGLLVERFIFSAVRRRTKSPVRLLILSVGVSQILLAITYVPKLVPTSGAPFPQPFTSHLEVGGVVLTGMSVLAMIVIPVLFVALWLFLEFTSIGKQTRAAASNPDAARLCGISVNRVSLITWGIAGGLSALAAVLNGPTTSTFNATALGPFLLMFTMGAAAVGAFVSIPAAVGGGVCLGLVYQVVAAETHNAGKAELAVFAVILAFILIRGRAIGRVFAVGGAAVPEHSAVRVPDVLRGKPLLRWAPRWLVGVALLVALIFPHLPYFASEPNRFLLVLVLVYALIGVALTALVGWAGQVSLGHFAVVGLAAYLTARWTAEGWNLLELIVVVGIIGAAAIVVVGLPALRVRGLTLAVATLGFAVIAPDWLYLRPAIGGDTPFTTFVLPPKPLPGLAPIGSQLELYYLVLLAIVIVVAATATLRRSSVGRIIIAVRDNERAAASFGIKATLVNLRVLALSGFIAAMAGVFWAIAWQSVAPTQFPADASVAIIAIPVVGGLGSLSGALAAAVLLYMSTFFVGPHLTPLFGSFGQNIGFLLFFSGIGVVVAMSALPNGIAGKVQDAWQAYLNRRAARLQPVDGVSVSDGAERPAAVAGTQTAITELKVAPLDARSVRTGARPTADGAAPPLVVEDIAVEFGGITAVDGADITVRDGEIVGLIGPNGAGKTTLMNVISGITRPQRGSVRVFGHEVTSRSPTVRARYGVARSFQDASLFAGLTVTETIQVALAHRSKNRMLPALVGAPWLRAAERDTRRRALELVDTFGLTPWADALTVELSTGLKRICDLAAQVAAEPQLLLLDEPTAGVAQREAEAFGPLVRRIRDELGCAILVIEHDMPMLMGLCDRVYAMEAGGVIAEGTPQEIRSNPMVIASYLGTDTAAVERSGRRADA